MGEARVVDEVRRRAHATWVALRGLVAGRPDEPRAVALVVRLVWVLVLLGVAMAALAVVLDDEILRASDAVGISPDDTRVPPSYNPVVIVLAVVVVSLVLVLLAFLRGGHTWARNCVAVAFAIIGVGFVALLVSGPPVAFVVPVAVWLLLDAALLSLLFRPAVSGFAAPRGARGPVT